MSQMLLTCRPNLQYQYIIIFWWEGAFGMAGYGVPHQRGTERELEGYMFCCLVVISITICSPNISNKHTFHDVRESLAVAWEMVKHFPTQNWMCHSHYRFNNNLTYHQISHGLPPCGSFHVILTYAYGLSAIPSDRKCCSLSPTMDVERDGQTLVISQYFPLYHGICHYDFAFDSLVELSWEHSKLTSVSDLCLFVIQSARHNCLGRSCFPQRCAQMHVYSHTLSYIIEFIQVICRLQ